MIGDRRVLGLIPARGGSKGLPHKNVLPLGGKPLLAWTVEAALACPAIDRVILSSDDEAIAAVAREYGCEVPFVRPANLATDTAGAIDVALHALDEVPGFDVLVLLQPTSPLRTAEDLARAAEVLDRSGAPSCVSVRPAMENPAWMFRLGGASELVPFVDPSQRPARRQDLDQAYVLNGALYYATTEQLRSARSFVTERTVAYVMPSDRSIDIDTAADLARAEAILGAGERDSG
ncbi:CMP-N,N'-diacetyllegionaminic acid synthase [Planctomycetes bacterium Poly30]|uniref:CMP-N,N'-diacetyllegionaminic acid synthase n=1 Tax=Saltatorellus ferox TaxID=2528018 RepID=A0A518EX28_9BACT|nr:CMP-N,N'-diacetyllegionaminic acid synthase [Planctomycetes bacterium Poly30]